MRDPLQIQYEERAMEARDLDDLEYISRDAGAATWSRKQLKSLTGHLTMDTRLIIAPESFEQLVGFYVVEHGDDILYLCNIAVANDWRRCGVASFALEAATNLGRELHYEKLALHVQEANLPAQLLYRKSGFQVVDIKHDHYPGQDGYYMVKNLDG